MKITEISEQKTPGRFNIFIDGKFALGIDEEIKFKFKLKSNMDISPEKLAEIIVEEEYTSCFKTAMDYISYKARTEKEVRKKLEDKDFNQETIDKTLAKIKNYDYINDEEFAKSYTRERLRNKKFGQIRIRQELYLKGIKEDIVDRVVQIDEDEEFEMALGIAEKRLRSYKNDDYNKKYRKLSAYLARRGYQYSTINRVLSRVLKHDR